MLELFSGLQCAHGGGPLHLLFDLWWMLILAIPGAPYLINKFGYKIKSFCCGHKQITRGKKNSRHHCDH